MTRRDAGDHLADAESRRVVYDPLSDLLRHAHSFSQAAPDTIGPRRAGARSVAATTTPPLVVGITGSVAAGKTTVAGIVATLAGEWASRPAVALVSTDGFLHPNHVLAARGLTMRKGFPESYDRAALASVLRSLRAADQTARVPVYSHVTYDIVPGAYVELGRPDVVVVEGLGLLVSPDDGAGVESLLDVTVYVDAPEALLERWYVERFVALCQAATGDASSFYARFATMPDTELADLARQVWHGINLPNLRDHIAPCRERADVIMEKGDDHRAIALHIRKP